jgi:hypothetical protein
MMGFSRGRAISSAHGVARRKSSEPMSYKSKTFVAPTNDTDWDVVITYVATTDARPGATITSR